LKIPEILAANRQIPRWLPFPELAFPTRQIPRQVVPDRRQAGWIDEFSISNWPAFAGAFSPTAVASTIPSLLIEMFVVSVENEMPGSTNISPVTLPACPRETS